MRPPRSPRLAAGIIAGPGKPPYLLPRWALMVEALGWLAALGILALAIFRKW